jgi:hypothetical protein
VTALARRVLGVSARAVGDLAAMDWNFQGPFDLDQSGPHGEASVLARRSSQIPMEPLVGSAQHFRWSMIAYR